MIEPNTPKAAVIEVMKVISRWREEADRYSREMKYSPEDADIGLLQAADEIMTAIKKGMPGESQG